MSKEVESSIPASFVKFYDDFHKDSIYQIEHIIFPLDGKPQMMDSMINNYQWQKSDWAMHNDMTTEQSEFSQSFEIVDPTIIEEYIIHQTAGFGIFRRFSLIGGEWYLIYYIGMNPPEMMR